MTTAFPLGLTLQIGLHADSGPTRVRSRFRTAWGRTEVFAANAAAWDVTEVKGWSQVSVWSLTLTQSLACGYDVRLETRLWVPYGDRPVRRGRSVVPYGDLRPHSGRFVASYGDRVQHRRSMRHGWWLTQSVWANHALGYAVTDTNPVQGHLVSAWSLLSDHSLQAVANTPELNWQGERLQLHQATLSCDEESPAWIASLELAELADFAAIGITDRIILTLGLETFRLIVDGKTLSRESMTGRRCAISAISPVALLDAPFAGTMSFHRTEATSAQTAVEQLIGPVSWRLPNWVIPAGRLLLENVTPLEAARNIVAAIGGIIESNPDGSLVARRRHPVSIPQYGAAATAHSLFDADVLTASAQIAPNRGFNRVTIANEDGAQVGSSDSIEYLVDEQDSRRGRVRAYPSPDRAVRLMHTGHPDTVITIRGSVTRSEAERVEFIEGRATVRYPVIGITQATWQHADLGVIAIDARTLTSAAPGYSLLSIMYTTQSIDWDVALAVDEEVQFVLVDA